MTVIKLSIYKYHDSIN